MKKIVLSYSTIWMLKNDSHNWINKKLGILQPETYYQAEGKEGHRLIQEHVSRKNLMEELTKIQNMDKCYFPIVEEKDFDEKTAFYHDINDKYAIRGFADGLNQAEARILEIKLSSSGAWPITKFRDSNQRKVYAWAFPWAKEQIIVTGKRRPDEWNNQTMKVGRVTITEQDRKDGLAFIMEGIEIIEKGEFAGGLDENGKCTNRWCNYGNNCIFK